MTRVLGLELRLLKLSCCIIRLIKCLVSERIGVTASKVTGALRGGLEGVSEREIARVHISKILNVDFICWFFFLLSQEFWHVAVIILAGIYWTTTSKPKDIWGAESWLSVGLELILWGHATHHWILVKRHLLLICLKLSELWLLLELRLLLVCSEILGHLRLLEICQKLIW